MGLHYIVKKGSDIVLREEVGETFSIYNGKSFILLFIELPMVGYRYGEFCLTRKKAKLKKKKEKGGKN